jgi:hypothetical protein
MCLLICSVLWYNIVFRLIQGLKTQGNRENLEAINSCQQKIAGHLLEPWLAPFCSKLNPFLHFWLPLYSSKISNVNFWVSLVFRKLYRLSGLVLTRNWDQMKNYRCDSSFGTTTVSVASNGRQLRNHSVPESLDASKSYSQ